MVRERIWTRIYVDRMKLTSLSNYLGHGGKRNDLGVRDWIKGPEHVRFDLERVFAKLPIDKVISDTSIDEIADKIAESRKPLSVAEVVARLLSEQEVEESSVSPKGELVVVEAAIPLHEGIGIPRPDGNILPLLDRGSYLAYRKPFAKLPLFDGTYHSAILYDFYALGSFDLFKVYLKETDEVDPKALLESWDNSHARVLGLLGACPPYRCTTRVREPETKWRVSFGLFALLIDVSPFDDLDVAQRMSNWRAI